MSSLFRRNSLKWLYPGMHIKRWLGLVVFGLLFISLGIAYLFVEAYRTYAFPEFAATLTLQFLPRVLRALLFAVIGGSVVGLALIKLNMSLLSRWRRTATVSWSTSSTAAGSATAVPRLSPSAAAPGSRRCFAGSKSTPTTSPPSSPWPTTAAAPDACGASSGYCLPATSGTASWRSPSPSR